MKRQAADFGIKIFSIFLISFCLFTCGIDEYFFLPQVEQNLIETEFNTWATVNLPQIPKDVHAYATGYRIFYRIYLSGVDGGSMDNPNFSSSFTSDYRAFESLRDPTNTTSIPTINTFSSQRYYELDYQISTNGGTLVFLFPATGLVFNPHVTLNNGAPVDLRRNNEFVPSDQHHEPFFRNTSGLNEASDSTSRKNMDVASGQTTGHAYAAMYIVAVGQNPLNFSNIFSKPTFISVFKLPNI